MPEAREKSGSHVHPGAQDDPNDTHEPPVTQPAPPDEAERAAAGDDADRDEMPATPPQPATST